MTKKIASLCLDALLLAALIFLIYRDNSLRAQQEETRAIVQEHMQQHEGK